MSILNPEATDEMLDLNIAPSSRLRDSLRAGVKVPRGTPAGFKQAIGARTSKKERKN